MTVDSDPVKTKEPDAIYPHHFTPDVLEKMCRAYDAESAAQEGERDPWYLRIGHDPVWVAERCVAMACAVEAMLEAAGQDATAFTAESRRELVRRLRPSQGAFSSLDVANSKIRRQRLIP